jgi:hypothetical protein
LALLLLPKETVFSYTTKRPMPLFRTGGWGQNCFS